MPNSGEQTKQLPSSSPSMRIMQAPEFPAYLQMTEADYQAAEPLVRPHFETLQSLVLFLDHQYFLTDPSGESPDAKAWEQVLDRLLQRLSIGTSDFLSQLARFRSWRELFGYYLRNDIDKASILPAEELLEGVRSDLSELFPDFDWEAFHNELLQFAADEKKRKAKNTLSPEEATKQFAALLKSSKWRKTFPET